MTISRVRKYFRGRRASGNTLQVKPAGFRKKLPSANLGCFTLIAFLTTLLAFSATGLGQASGGQLAGTVSDSSGAIIAGATVSAINATSGSSYSTVTSSAGAYNFPSMLVGTYTVTVNANGFEVQKSTGVIVEIGTSATLNFHLHAGSTSQTVTVMADTLRPQTESVDSSTILPPEMAEQLPLAVGNGAMRNAGDFVFLTPGTVGGTGSTGVTWEDRIGAGQSDGSEVLVDGATAQTADFGDASTAELLPSIDAVEEFNVSIAGMPPQYDHTTGGIQSYTTKSGTNVIHGTAYEIFRNTGLDANGWFNNAYDLPRNPDMRNEYGVTFGAPVRIPHLYDGRNKTFVFFSWEQFRQTNGFLGTGSVPTLANRTGDFSAFLGDSLGVDPCGQTIYHGEIFDPTTTFTGPGGVSCRKPFDYNGQLNVMDPARITGVAKNVIAYWPTPSNSAIVNNYHYNPSWPLIDTAETIRVDESFSDHDKLFVSYNPRENERSETGDPDLPNPLDSNSSVQDLFTHMTRIGETHVFKSGLVNQVTLGYLRIYNNVFSHGANHNYDSALGIQGINANGFPAMSFSSQEVGLTPIGDNATQSLVVNNLWNLNDSIVGTFGRHTITLGTDLRYYQTNLINGDAPGGFGFGSGETADTTSEIGNTGNGFASFLLGDLSGAGYSVQVHQPKDLNYYSAIYAQDVWKVTPNLQLLLGLRYSVDLPFREADNDRSTFSPTASNPGAGNIPGALIFAGSGAGRTGGSSRFANAWYKDFAPRVGFTYAPDFLHNRTVLRGSFSTVYGPLTTDDSGYGVGAGFTPVASYSDSSSGGYISPANINNPFPTLPAVINTDPTQLNGSSPMATLRSFGRPSMNNIWSIDVQNQLASNLLFTATYIGSKSTHLHSNIMYLNNLNPSNFALGTALNDTVTGGPYAGFAGTRAQSLRPFPQYAYIDTYDGQENIGQASYEALITKLERRFRNGFTLLASYTWSKQLTDADSFNFGGAGVQNPYDLKKEKSVSQFDIPNLVMINYLYELPFGHNKPFLHSNAALNTLVGGWQIGAIHRYFEGQPNEISCANGIPGSDTCIRFNYVSGQPVASAAARNHTFNPLTDVYLNVNAFVDPNANIATQGGAYQLGDVPRTLSGFLGSRLPTFYDEDFSIVKRFPFVREQNIEFKAELFNAFNRHVWGGPNTEPYSGAAFGQVTYTASTARQIQFQLRIHY